MAAAPSSASFVQSRRRLFAALFTSAGIEDIDPSLAMRRPGRDGFREDDLPQSPAVLSFPPAAVRWLSRCRTPSARASDGRAAPGVTRTAMRAPARAKSLRSGRSRGIARATL